MYKITYYVGCNDKDTLKQELSYKDFMNVFNFVFIDYTLQECKGVFTNLEGKRTFETSFIITILSDEDSHIRKKAIKSKCNHLKKLLNQESILVTKELIQASFM